MKFKITLINNDINNTAEEIFKQNLGTHIKVGMISNGIIFKGKLITLSCNTFIVETEDRYIEMFRYEDVKYLQVINNKK